MRDLFVADQIVQLLELVLSAGYREGGRFGPSVLSLSFLSHGFGLLVLLGHVAHSERRVTTRQGGAPTGC